MVGCDGARSMVRRWMGVGSNGSDFDQKMCLAVFRSTELHEHLSRFPESTTFRALDPELQGYWMFFGRVEVGKSWFFHAPVPEDATPENYDFQGAAGEGRGRAVQGGVRPRGLLEPAGVRRRTSTRWGGCSSRGTRRTVTRRTGASG